MTDQKPDLMEIFGNKSVVHRLLAKALQDNPVEEQIDMIWDIIEERWKDDKATIVMLNALETLHEDKVAFRQSLMKLYDKIEWREPARENLAEMEFNPPKYFAPKLQLAFLEKIMMGWKWRSPDKKDSKKSFQFICREYSKSIEYTAPGRRNDVEKGIIDLFHDVFKRSPSLAYPILDQWICGSGQSSECKVPDDIKKILLKKRVDMAGPDIMTDEIAFLRTIEFQSRESPIRSAVINYINEINRLAKTFDIFKQFVRDILKSDKSVNIGYPVLAELGREDSKMQFEYEIKGYDQLIIKVTFFGHIPENDLTMQNAMKEMIALKDTMGSLFENGSFIDIEKISFVFQVNYKGKIKEVGFNEALFADKGGESD